jgi:hypothetical protein
MSMRVAVLGLVALVACAGCATGTGSISNGSNGAASPRTGDVQQQIQQCEGWYDSVAGACDSMGS